MFASRVANKRIFSSTAMVDYLITDYTNLGTECITARRLALHAKRTIMSNVSLCIPNDILKIQLKSIILNYYLTYKL